MLDRKWNASKLGCKKMVGYLTLAALLILCPNLVSAQSAADIKIGLEKLAQTSRVLYIAAHPDDENTRLISYLENDLKVQTAYLSLTRGSGGQNLIGKEKGESLAILRTQELLEARKVDGAEQFFTRAVDFGYSKNAKETFTKWKKDSILHDIVWVIRKFQPTTIITRFPPNSKAGHGHHTASAMLAEEAFKAAGNPYIFPEQLQLVKTWQPEQLYFNNSTWWDKDLADKAETNDSIFKINVGEFNPLLGLSYGEIASSARSKHRCQGFGTALQRGDKMEYLTLIKGELNESGNVLLNDDWSKLRHGIIIKAQLRKLNANFDFYQPEKSITTLIALLHVLENEPTDAAWIETKKEEIKQLVLDCSGVHDAWYADKNKYSPGDSIIVEQRVIQRRISNLMYVSSSFDKRVHRKENRFNEVEKFVFRSAIEDNQEYTCPYYLKAPFTFMYQQNDYINLGHPESAPDLLGFTTWSYKGYEFTTTNTVKYNYIDRAIGEITEPVHIIPKVSIELEKDLIINSNNKNTSLKVFVNNNSSHGIAGSLSAIHSNNLQVNFNTKKLSIEPYGTQEITVSFKSVQPNLNEKVQFAFNGTTLNQITEVNYDHIDKQVWTNEATLTFKQINLKIGDEKIAYIQGSGDDVATYLQNVGYKVDIISDKELKTFKPENYDVVVLGIRALNVNKNLPLIADKINVFVFNGGRLIIQYNTNRGMITPYYGPLDFTVSRERVTEENATPNFINPDHPACHYPNKISTNDFNQWVQERGLYFADNWNEKFVPLIGWSDTNEESKNGALIIGNHGRGSVIYTGISFFRQLPAGVPGAYRLLANLISHPNE